MTMFNPPHPGETLLEDVFPELDISIAEVARRLGFARQSLSRIVHGHAPVSPDLAVRLESTGIAKNAACIGGRLQSPCESTSSSSSGAVAAAVSWRWGVLAIHV